MTKRRGLGNRDLVHAQSGPAVGTGTIRSYAAQLGEFLQGPRAAAVDAGPDDRKGKGVGVQPYPGVTTWLLSERDHEQGEPFSLFRRKTGRVSPHR